MTSRVQRPVSRPRPRHARAAMRAAVLGVLAALALAACGGAEVSDASEEPSASSASQTPSPATPASPAESSSSDMGGKGEEGDKGDERDKDGTTQQTEEAAPESVVPAALQFQATTVSGDAFDGASVAGRPVVLWFWAPWCAVCKSQVPTVTGLADQYGDDVAFVGVGGLDGTDAIRAFADDVPGLTHLSDPGGDLYQRFGISEQSSFVVLDAAGGEALRTGYANDDALSAVVADVAG
ncbi:MAG: redoxin domain-containing protein [Nocardioides sp.]|uniref:redoxin domain-containing protein n=1 Tax=Nocardioides sp. TaxID=35761 RepID=UPI002385C7A3|nr:redoxin domain-containing protein [Nocardioides sp.]MDE0778511.1 redoxin domain-containing protein [Nocardioides sp.]